MALPAAPTFAGKPAIVVQWALQVGAYYDAGTAQAIIRQALAAAPALRGNTTSSVDRIAAGNRVLYRARLITSDEDLAFRGCQMLQARKIACTPVELGTNASAQLR